MKRIKNMAALTMALALAATLTVGGVTAAAEEEEKMETVEVNVEDLMAGYEDGMADHLADTLRPMLIAPAPGSGSHAAGQYGITVNGVALDAQACVMVPLRKVAEALGYTVTWHGDTKSVTVETGKMHTEVVLGQDRYFAATSIPGAVGMTAPFSLGIPPYCVDGVTYVPVGLFRVLEGNAEGAIRFENGNVAIGTKAPEEEKVDVVIVSVEEKFSEEELNALLEKYHMTVLYDYQSFNMYAFKLEKALDKTEMAAFCETLAAEKGVLSAEPDSKVELMDGAAGLSSLN